MPVFNIKAKANRNRIHQPFVAVQQAYPRLLIAVYTLRHENLIG